MKNVPDIRFKGFDEKWKMSFVYDIAKHSSAKLSESSLDAKFYKYPVYGASGFIRKIDTYDMSKPYLAVVKDGAGVGNIYKLPAYSSVLSTLHYLTPTNVNIDILLCVLQNLNLSKRSSGSTIPHLYYKNYKDEIVFIPENTEQKLISSYIVEIKKVIIEIEKKIASLKQLKSACLISMFPQQGETVPRVRFKGFDGEWKKVKLSNCLEISKDINSVNVYGKEDVLSVSDEMGVMNQIKLLGRSYAGKSVSKYKILKPHQIVYTKSPLKDKPYGIIKENCGETGIVSVLYAVFNTKENVDPTYIHYYFEPKFRINKYLYPLVNKGAKNTMNISDDTTLDGFVYIPSSEAEQHQIASYFRNLDIQISEQEKRLEKLKQIKAACLDKMFV